MLNNMRQEDMKEFIRTKKNVTMQQLIDHFNVSNMTVRRDLIQLENIGVIKRVHGGAVFLEPVEEVVLSVRELKQREQKERIAEKAAAMIQEGDVILLDGGTTTQAVAQKIVDRKSLTVITNAVNIALLLSQYSNISVVMPGGDILHTTQSLVGPATIKFLQTLRVDKAFIGCGGISLERGLLNANILEGEVKQVMMQIARESYAVADHTKFDQDTFYVFGTLQQVDGIISTNELNESVKKAFANMDGPELILV